MKDFSGDRNSSVLRIPWAAAALVFSCRISLRSSAFCLSRFFGVLGVLIHGFGGSTTFPQAWGRRTDSEERANAQQPKLFVGMILILIFAEALALYGLIVGIILSSRAGQSRAE
ncbi:unnamed protein product [Spirodela intermedia]|uniref:V-ATPase proteolipid subunit C-like domain-containing protein n=1 Tax=Spirodela intermedia TaxID=51605 RepID=A0A7I8JC19_SPIIN|nr:unnamed protein product [Spirodela intermedia]CAA6667670.1 unnamed protein product [Spirodela intermedia]